MYFVIVFQKTSNDPSEPLELASSGSGQRQAAGLAERSDVLRAAEEGAAHPTSLRQLPQVPGPVQPGHRDARRADRARRALPGQVRHPLQVVQGLRGEQGGEWLGALRGPRRRGGAPRVHARRQQLLARDRLPLVQAVRRQLPRRQLVPAAAEHGPDRALQAGNRVFMRSNVRPSEGEY